MKTGKEAFRKAIEFRSPDCLPSTIEVDFDFLRDKDEEKRAAIRSLLEAVPRCMESYHCWLDTTETRGGVVYRHDEWNVLWQDDGHGMITTYHPMEDGYEYIDRVNFPNPADQHRF